MGGFGCAFVFPSPALCSRIGHLIRGREFLEGQLITLPSFASFRLCWMEGAGSFHFLSPSILSPMRKNMIEERNCLYCRNSFQAERLDETIEGGCKKKFCSHLCKRKYQKENGYRGEEWDTIRKKILQRDGVCVMCGASEKLQIHHISLWHETHDNSEENLVCLCGKCHVKEDNRMIRFHKVSRKIIFYIQNVSRMSSASRPVLSHTDI